LFYSKHIQTVLKSLFSDQNHDEKGEHDDKSANQVEHDTSDEENNDDIEPNATTIHVVSKQDKREGSQQREIKSPVTKRSKTQGG